MIKKIILIIISVLVVLLILEGVVRFLRLNKVFTKEGCTYYSDNINSLQFRDVEHRLNKFESTYRVLILGDSFAYGASVAFEDMFARLIEKGWNSNNDNKIEVINCSRPGWNTEKEVSFCMKVFLPYKPDLIIVSYVLNDTECLMHNKHITLDYWKRIEFHEPKSKIIQHIFKKSELFRYLYSRVENTRIKKEWISGKMIFYQDDNICYKHFEKAVNNLKKAMIENNFKVLVVIFPYFNLSLKDYPFINIHNKVKYVFTKAGFDVIDLYDYYRVYDEDELKSCFSDAHPNELANKIAADVIVNYISKVK